jgi:hypothetical protein
MDDAAIHDLAGKVIEKRRERRPIALSHHMAEFKFPDAPTYQLKLQDVSPNGAGVIVRRDSKFLSMVSVGQELNLRLLSPSRSEIITGDYKATVEHITELKEGRYSGHFVVGLSMLKKIPEGQSEGRVIDDLRL